MRHLERIDPPGNDLTRPGAGSFEAGADVFHRSFQISVVRPLSRLEMFGLARHWYDIIFSRHDEAGSGRMRRASYCLGFNTAFDDLPRLGNIAHSSAEVQQSAGFQKLTVVPVWRRGRGGAEVFGHYGVYLLL